MQNQTPSPQSAGVHLYFGSAAPIGHEGSG